MADEERLPAVSDALMSSDDESTADARTRVLDIHDLARRFSFPGNKRATLRVNERATLRVTN